MIRLCRRLCCKVDEGETEHGADITQHDACGSEGESSGKRAVQKLGRDGRGQGERREMEEQEGNEVVGRKRAASS